MARFAFFTLAQIVLDAPPSWWLAAYKFTLPASKRPRIDRLNAEMGGAALLALKRSLGGMKCVMPALPFYSWVCEW